MSKDNLQQKRQRLINLFEINGQYDVDELIKILLKNGILEDDPRATQFFQLRDKISNENQKIKLQNRLVEKKQFEQLIDCIFELAIQCIEQGMVIPKFEEFCEQIDKCFYESQQNSQGNVASYIPELKYVDPSLYCVAFCSIDGQRYEIGDSEQTFCIQSCSKPITFALAQEELGSEKVQQHIGYEPSGQKFNEIILDPQNRPHNPLINAGAIMACSLVKIGKPPGERYDYLYKKWLDLSGGIDEITMDNAVYLSERYDSDRNFALAHLMKSKNVFPPNTDITDILELYFQCCSLTMKSRTLACVAATLANGGVCPLTSKRVLKQETVQNVLSSMFANGMYDYSGEFAVKCGIPCKSGVSGTLMAVIPGVGGFCTFSPRIDENGNSNRGLEFFDRLLECFNFHIYDFIKVDPTNRFNKNENFIIKVNNAAHSGDLTMLNVYYRQYKPDFEIADYDQRGPVHLAAEEGHLDCVIQLIKKFKCKKNLLDLNNNTPLDCAIQKLELLNDPKEILNQQKIIAFLKENGATRNRGNSSISEVEND